MIVKTQCFMGNKSIRKLNRDPKHWFRLNFMMMFLAISSALYIIVSSASLFYIITPTIVTKRGFEFSYPNCVSYIRSQVKRSATRAREYESIYNCSMEQLEASPFEPGSISELKYRPVPIVLPMEDFATGSYHRVRIIFDYITSMGFFCDGMIFLVSHDP